MSSAAEPLAAGDYTRNLHPMAMALIPRVEQSLVVLERAFVRVVLGGSAAFADFLIKTCSCGMFIGATVLTV